MEQRVACDEHADHRDHHEVAPIPADDDLAQHIATEDDGAGEVDQRHRQGRERFGGHDRNPAEDPEREQACQGPSRERRPARPVRRGGEQESREYRAEIAEQRLVGMPGHRVEGTRQLEPSGERREPERHGE